MCIKQAVCHRWMRGAPTYCLKSFGVYGNNYFCLVTCTVNSVTSYLIHTLSRGKGAPTIPTTEQIQRKNEKSGNCAFLPEPGSTSSTQYDWGPLVPVGAPETRDPSLTPLSLRSSCHFQQKLTAVIKHRRLPKAAREREKQRHVEGRTEAMSPVYFLEEESLLHR